MPKADGLGTWRDMLIKRSKDQSFNWEPEFHIFQGDNALTGPVVGGCDGTLNLQEAAASIGCVLY